MLNIQKIRCENKFTAEFFDLIVNFLSGHTYVRYNLYNKIIKNILDCENKGGGDMTSRKFYKIPP